MNNTNNRKISEIMFLQLFMSGNYFKTTLRYFKKNKGLFFTNVFGLSVGLACCLLIFIFIHNKTSFDKFHQDHENIHRIATIFNTSGNVKKYANTPPALIHNLRKEYPEIIEATRMRYTRRILFSMGEKSFYENYGFYADSKMLKVFDFKLLSGDSNKALAESNTIVMTEDMAMKYFGNPRPIGRSIRVEGNKMLKVTGILAPIPKNSHLQFNFLISFTTYVVPDGYRSDLTSWTWAGFLTYIKTVPKTNITNLNKKINLHFKKIINNPNFKLEVNIQKLKDIYLGSKGIADDLNSHIQSGNVFTLYALGIISILVLVIAGFNFMNLTASNSMKRGKEISMRKVLGADKRTLVFQILFESIFISVIALLLAFFWCFLIYINFRSFFIWETLTGFGDLFYFLPLILLSCILLGVLSGLYPAFLLAGFNTINMLKGRFTSGKGKSSKVSLGLVVIQFVISAGLIASSFIIFNQIKYINEISLGVEKDNLITVKLPSEDMRNYYNTFKDRLLQNGFVVNVSKGQRLIGEPWPVNSLSVINNEAEAKLISSGQVGYDYIEAIGIKLKEGRTFSKKFVTDPEQAIILNEKAVNFFDIKDPIGKKVNFFNVKGPRTIIGVVKDFNFETLHEKITPLVMIMPITEPRYLHIKITPGNNSENITRIEKDWKSIAPGIPLDWNFMDDRLDRLYANEMNLSELITGFSILAIFLACLGLFGLISFIINNRLKEIGIRKVLGASITSILLLIFRPYIIMTFAAMLLTYPLTLLIMNQWLRNFAYHIEISFLYSLSAGLILLIICLATISLKTVKAALSNPTEVLRSE